MAGDKETTAPSRHLNTDIQIQVMSCSQNWWKESPISAFAEYVMDTVILGIDEEVLMRKTYVFDEINRFAPDDPETAYHAKCYNRVRGRFVPVGYTPLNFIKGDGNVHSTIRDMAMWERFLHTLDYHLPARELLWSPVLIKNNKQVNYGAGWRLLREKFEGPVKIKGRWYTRKHEYRGEYHRGEWLGWRSFIGRASKWVVPPGGKRIDARRAESLGVIVLSNADFGDDTVHHLPYCPGDIQVVSGQVEKRQHHE